MAKCGNCNIDHKSVEEMVLHQNLVHGSEFDESEEAHARYVPIQARVRTDPETKSAAALLKRLSGKV